MTEEAIMFTELPFQIIRTLVLIVFLITVLVFFIVAFRETELNYLEKAARETGSVILSGKATETAGVLLVERLDNIRDSGGELTGICGYGYKIEIEGNGKKWLFQDFNRKGIPIGKKEFKIGLKEDEKIFPGKLKVTLYETPLPRIACTIESAYETATIQEIPSYELNILSQAGWKGLSYAYLFNMKKTNGKLCAEDSEGKEIEKCVKLDAPFHDFNALLGPANAGVDKTLKVIPVKKGVDITSTSYICSDIERSKAEKPEDIGTVVICVVDPGLFNKNIGGSVQI
jgi:hypothetical protein